MIFKYLAISFLTLFLHQSLSSQTITSQADWDVFGGSFANRNIEIATGADIVSTDGMTIIGGTLVIRDGGSLTIAEGFMSLQSTTIIVNGTFDADVEINMIQSDINNISGTLVLGDLIMNGGNERSTIVNFNNMTTTSDIFMFGDNLIRSDDLWTAMGSINISSGGEISLRSDHVYTGVSNFDGAGTVTNDGTINSIGDFSILSEISFVNNGNILNVPGELIIDTDATFINNGELSILSDGMD